jgi:hypothetical protein
MSMRTWLGIAAIAFAFVAAQANADSTPQPPLSHFADHGIAFDYPASWQTYETKYRGLNWIPLVYIGSQPLREPCVSTPNSLSCSWPVDALNENSVVASWAVIGLPSFGRKKKHRLPRHNTIRINGTRVRFYITRPGCAQIGGDELITLGAPYPISADFAACLRGPRLDLVEKQVFAMLRSTKFSRS